MLVVNMVRLFWLLRLVFAIPQQGFRQGLSSELTEKRLEDEHVASQFNDLLQSTQGSLLAHPMLTLLGTVVLVLTLYLLSLHFYRMFGRQSDVRVILQPKGVPAPMTAAQVRRYTTCKELLY